MKQTNGDVGEDAWG
jgi:hypothetical protein